MDEATVEQVLLRVSFVFPLLIIIPPLLRRRALALNRQHIITCSVLKFGAPFVALLSVILRETGRVKFSSELVIVRSATFDAWNRYTPPVPVGVATNHMTRHAVLPPNNLGTDASYITHRRRISQFFCLKSCCHNNVQRLLTLNVMVQWLALQGGSRFISRSGDRLSSLRL